MILQSKTLIWLTASNVYSFSVFYFHASFNHILQKHIKSMIFSFIILTLSDFKMCCYVEKMFTTDRKFDVVIRK